MMPPCLIQIGPAAPPTPAKPASSATPSDPFGALPTRRLSPAYDGAKPARGKANAKAALRQGPDQQARQGKTDKGVNFAELVALALSGGSPAAKATAASGQSHTGERTRPQAKSAEQGTAGRRTQPESGLMAAHGLSKTAAMPSGTQIYS